jgi:K+ transporter
MIFQIVLRTIYVRAMRIAYGSCRTVCAYGAATAVSQRVRSKVQQANVYGAVSSVVTVVVTVVYRLEVGTPN